MLQDLARFAGSEKTVAKECKEAINVSGKKVAEKKHGNHQKFLSSMIVQARNGWHCKECGKGSSKRGQVIRHVETCHMDGFGR